MIRQLPESLNWQTVFIKFYGDLFADMLLVEKWWAVMIVQLTGQNQYQNWTLLEAVEKLEDLLKLPAEVKLNSADSPLEAEITLQQALRGWDFDAAAWPQQKINQLDSCPAEDAAATAAVRKRVRPHPRDVFGQADACRQLQAAPGTGPPEGGPDHRRGGAVARRSGPATVVIKPEVATPKTGHRNPDDNSHQLMPRESIKAKTERTAAIIDGLKQTYPDARRELDYTNPLELLIATILLAQCTDKQVNIVTADLFKNTVARLTTLPCRWSRCRRTSSASVCFATRPRAFKTVAAH